MKEDKRKTRLLRERLRSNYSEQALKTLYISLSFVMVNNRLKSPSSNLERKPETNYEHVMINRKYGAARNGNHT